MSEGAVSFDDFLRSLAVQVDRIFDTVELVSDEQGSVLFVHNEDASAIAGVKPHAAGPVNLILMRSIVVENIDESSFPQALLETNGLNEVANLGRWYLRPDLGAIFFDAEQVVMANHEYDEEELEVFMAMLETAYDRADQVDDVLVERIGSGNIAKRTLPPDWGPLGQA